jgi:hypothetical protein
MKLIRTSRSRELRRWLKQESAEQQRRYRAIAAAQDALAPKRDRWIAEFLARIQERGFQLHYDQLRRIRPDEIPSRPKRRFRVVF